MYDQQSTLQSKAGSLIPTDNNLSSYVRLTIEGVFYFSAGHLWCLFIMDFHYCNERTCMGIKVTKIISELGIFDLV